MGLILSCKKATCLVFQLNRHNNTTANHSCVYHNNYTTVVQLHDFYVHSPFSLTPLMELLGAMALTWYERLGAVPICSSARLTAHFLPGLRRFHTSLYVGLPDTSAHWAFVPLVSGLMGSVGAYWDPWWGSLMSHVKFRKFPCPVSLFFKVTCRF